MRAMNSTSMSSTIQKMILAGVLNVCLASGVQAESMERIYDTLTLVQQTIAATHPRVVEDRYWSQNGQRYRFEHRVDERRGLMGVTNPCMGRSGRYDEDCQFGRYEYRHDQYRHHHSRHHHDDHHRGKHHHKHKNKHGKHYSTYRSCDD